MDQALSDWLKRHSGPVLVYSPERKVVSLNSAAESCFGYRAEELIGKPLETLLPAGIDPKGIRKNGEQFPISLSFSSVGEGESELTAAILHDQSERIVGERKKAFSTRMLALGDMAGGIAHEVNNPLGIIGLRLELLDDLAKQTEIAPREVVDAARMMRAAAARIQDIVKGLQLFARGGKELGATSLRACQVIDDVLGFQKERFKYQDVEFSRGDCPENLCVLANKGAISEALFNLLNNAFQAAEGAPEPWVRLEVSESESSVEISVTDSGTGIPETIRERIFDPFYSKKEAGSGTGLGLSISMRLIQAQGGDLFLDPGSKNTRFVIRLPKGDPSVKLSPGERKR